MTSAVHIRLARLDEAKILSDLAMRAKAHWGYDDAFMEMCRAELTVQPGEIAAGHVWVGEIGGRIAGMVSVHPDRPQAELHMIFVEPGWIGHGVGRHLWARAEALARAAGASKMGVDSDPQAEGFYKTMGAVRVGQSPSGSIPGRVLPRLVKQFV